LINSLTLGNKQFPINLIQAPLAGVSCAPFRALTTEYGHPAFTCTEMISCKTILHQPEFAHTRYTAKSTAEGPVCYQLSANNPQELAAAVKIVTDAGADLIDLNCGCPVKKIRSKGAGSSLLMQPKKLYELITAMKQNTSLPVSIKIRVEGNSDEKFHDEIATVVSDAGADFITVHGRHWTEHYETPCCYEHIQYFVQVLKIPVIGNGDVRDIVSLKKMLATGCAGAMIGRAGVGQPWLIAKLVADMQGKPFTLPSQQEIGAIFLCHVEQLCGLLQNEKQAILQARKLAKYYARTMPDREQWMLAMNQCLSLRHLQQLVSAFFK